MKHRNSGKGTILAIDLGSTTFKAAVFDYGLRVVCRRACLLRQHVTANGRVEISVDDADACLRSVISGLHPDEGITAVAITSQAQTFTLLDNEHVTTSPFISWQDVGDPRFARQASAALPNFERHCSFPKPDASLQLCQVKRLGPEAGMRLVPLPAHFARLLTGRLITDDNLAAMSGLYSMETKDWWDDALDFCGLHRRQLPDVAPVGGVAGTTIANPFDIPVGRPVFLAGNDQTAGAYGAEIETSRKVLLTLGTALAAYSFSETMPSPAPGLVRGPYPGRGYYRMTTDSRGGNVLNWARRIIAGCASDQQFFDQAARVSAPSNAPVFDCDLKSGQGAWRNLGWHHTAADMALAVLQSIGQVAADLVRRMPNPDPCPGLLAAGGGSRQPLLLDIIANRLGHVPEPTDTAPLHGAARMAADGVGPAFQTCIQGGGRGPRQSNILPGPSGKNGPGH